MTKKLNDRKVIDIVALNNYLNGCINFHKVKEMTYKQLKDYIKCCYKKEKFQSIFTDPLEQEIYDYYTED